MGIAIIENSTGKILGNYTINLRGLNYTPSDKEFFSEAWQCAIEDGLVNADEHAKYNFRIS